MTIGIFKHSRCLLCCYGVLDTVSSDYPPVTGRLLTCYAPFCRSPAKYCYFPLPLDLHVLSLPLAFILSQDQTLHCTSFILYSSSTILTSSSLKGIYALMYFVLPYTSHTFFQVCCLSLSLFQSTVVRFPNGIAKVRLFSFIPNPNQKFLHFFWNYFSPQQSPQRNSLKNSALSQISTEGNFFINFYFLNNFVTKSSNKRKSQQTQITTSENHNKCRLQQV